jgi:hypothetical protein
VGLLLLWTLSVLVRNFLITAATFLHFIVSSAVVPSFVRFFFLCVLLLTSLLLLLLLCVLVLVLGLVLGAGGSFTWLRRVALALGALRCVGGGLVHATLRHVADAIALTTIVVDDTAVVLTIRFTAFLLRLLCTRFWCLCAVWWWLMC